MAELSRPQLHDLVREIYDLLWIPPANDWNPDTVDEIGQALIKRGIHPREDH